MSVCVRGSLGRLMGVGAGHGIENRQVVELAFPHLPPFPALPALLVVRELVKVLIYDERLLLLFYWLIRGMRKHNPKPHISMWRYKIAAEA
jgi:hypothetical protein